jgi:hypothetical protein
MILLVVAYVSRDWMDVKAALSIVILRNTDGVGRLPRHMKRNRIYKSCLVV